ncbi:putative mitochondrial protein [Xylariaceae sp. FL0255]|nr:putative mitochondrial protein [Xylariaceae sp. FL0255]
MAARVLLRQRAAVPLIAATLVGGALYPSVALAEAPSQSHPIFANKKPIYDDFENIPLPKHTTPVPSPSSDTIPQTSSPASSQPDVIELIPRRPTPTDRLALQVGKARRFLYKHAVTAEDAINNAIDEVFHLERSFSSTIASLAPSRESGEQLMPGLVYVLVASMAGSILSRNRNILLRASLPVALGIGAGWVVIPVTMGNVSDLIWTYEKRFPLVADAHITTREKAQRMWDMTVLHADLSKNYVEEAVGNARGTVEDWVKKGK